MPPRPISAVSKTDFLRDMVKSVKALPEDRINSSEIIYCAALCFKSRSERGDYLSCNSFIIDEQAGVRSCVLGYADPTWILNSQIE